MKTPWLLCLLGLGDCTFPPYTASFVAPGHGELSHRKTDLPQRLEADDDASLLNYEGEPCNTPSPPFFFNDDGGGGDAQASALPPWSDEEFAFSSFANWLDRSSGLMVGRYPGVEPSRCTNATCAEEHLKQLVANARVTTWVCFQAEIPAQQQALAAPYAALVKRHASNPLGAPGPAAAGPGAAPPGGFVVPVPGLPAPDPWAAVTAEEWVPGVANAFYEGGRSGDFGAYAPTAARLAQTLGRPPPRFLHFPVMDLTAPSLPNLRAMAHAVKVRSAWLDGVAGRRGC